MLDKDGSEIVSNEPMALPVGFKRPPTMQEMVARLVHGALSQRAAEQGMETFEEAEDFDIPDDPVDPSTPWEEAYEKSTTLQREFLNAKRHKEERELEEKLSSKRKGKSKPPSQEAAPPPKDEEADPDPVQ